MLQPKVSHQSDQCPQVGSGKYSILQLMVLRLTVLQDPPNLTDSGPAPDLPARPTTAAPPVATPPPVTPAPDINEQARMLKQYEDQQAALAAAREEEERQRREMEEAQRREFERRQAEQAEQQRLAQEQLMQQQMMQYNNQAAQQAAQQMMDLERELLGMRGQYERDQLMLEQYDRVRICPSWCKFRRLTLCNRGSKPLRAS